MAKDGNARRRIALALVAVTAAGSVALGGSAAGAAQRVAERCPTNRTGQVRTDTTTGETIQCATGADGLRWRIVPRWTRTAELAGPTPAQLITPAAPAPTTTPAGAPRAIADPLPADLGDPTGLPPGVVLPPGTATRAGSPVRLPAIDWWKLNRWLTMADVAGTDLEAAHAHFVDQCTAIGWVHDIERDQRLPTRPWANRSYDRSVQMVIGTCRTTAGSATDPTRRRPWYLAWSVALRPGASQLELVVELRDTNPHGGRFG